MQKHSKNSKQIFVATALSVAIAGQVVVAEVAPPEPAAPASQAPARTQTQTEGAAANAYSDAKKEAADPTALDYLFNKKPQDGTAGKSASNLSGMIADKVKAMDVLNQPGYSEPAMREQFERYLNSAEADAAQIANYNGIYKAMLEALRKNNPTEAWRLLYKLNEFPWDGGVSAELGNRIEAIWDAGQARNRLQASNEALRTAIRDANWSADGIAKSADSGLGVTAQPKSVPPKQAPRPSANNPTNGADPAATSIEANFPNIPGKLQMTEQYLKSLESKIRIKQNELKGEKIAAQTKADFADTVSTLFASKLYRQVIIAANFYRQLFGDGDYPVTMGNQVNKSIENLSAIEQGVGVFAYQIQNKELAAASRTLQSMFLIGDNDPALRGIPRESKRMVSKYAAQVQRMQNLIEARDFGALEPLVAEASKEVVDFEPAKPMSLVNAVKLESKMRLGKAKLAAQRGDSATALEEFKAAAEAWPANPELESAASLFFQSQEVKTQGSAEFDRLILEQNYRGIFDKQLPFLAAVKDDPKREKQLKEALLKVKQSEMALEKANLLQRNGDAMGAWETLAIAAKDWPEDGKLTQRLSELALNSVEFVSALNKAQDAEKRGQLGLSLSLYVNAQRYYPSSQFANEGIKRVSDGLLTKEH